MEWIFLIVLIIPFTIWFIKSAGKQSKKSYFLWGIIPPICFLIPLAVQSLYMRSLYSGKEINLIERLLFGILTHGWFSWVIGIISCCIIYFIFLSKRRQA